MLSWPHMVLWIAGVILVVSVALVLIAATAGGLAFPREPLP